MQSVLTMTEWRDIGATITNLLLAVHFVLFVLISLRVLSRLDLSSTARLSWMMILILLPYISVLIYWMFGEVHLGRDFNKKYARSREKIKDLVLADDTDKILTHHVAPAHHPALIYATKTTGFATTSGNKVTLMADADDLHQRMIADFDQAEDHIHCLYYIWLDDHTGNQVADALIRAAKRGVACRAMVDGLGSRALLKSALWQRLQAAGVETSVGLPITHLIKTLLLSRIDLRNHRKITVIDGKISYCGSSNCADPEFRVKPKYAPWVDIMTRVQGPVVAQNQKLFASDWLAENPDTPIEVFECQTSTFDDDVIAQVFCDGPILRKGLTPQFLSVLIGQARRQIVISTPYFVPDQTLIDAICAAAYRDVDVTMIFPKHNDSFVVAATSKSHYQELLEAGVTLFEYRPGLLHAKTLTIDDQVSLIGSTNLDLRSFDLNYENNMIFVDADVTRQIYQRQQQYIADADPVSLQTVTSWRLSRRIWNNVVATIGPIL